MAIEGLYSIFEHWHKQGTVWIYSDTHFNDPDVETNIPSRPTAKEHIKLINSKVGRKDTLILLGDVGDLNCASQLRGYKVLIAGNHDTGLTTYKEVFQEIYAGPLMISPKLILSHEPLDIDFAFNIHGHIHDKQTKELPNHFNMCADVLNYSPVNFNQWMKAGHLARISTIHRTTIDKATNRKRKRK